MRLTLRHYYDFGDKAETIGKNLNNAPAWEALRLGKGSPDIFSIPPDAMKWRDKCLNDTLLIKRAEDILALLDPGIKKIFSYGVGVGCLEYLLKKKNPQIILRCSDFTPQAIRYLQDIFKEADEIALFDILKGNWVSAGTDCVHLFHRVDTEFDDGEWQWIFQRMHAGGVQNVLFVPSQVLTFSQIFYHLSKNLFYGISRKKITAAGYLRTSGQLQFLFRRFYSLQKTVKIGDLVGYLLRLKN